MVKVAVCEDSEMERELLKRLISSLLTDRGLTYRLLTFSSGEELIGTYQENSYDLIFLDIHMGEIDGLEVGRRIRELDSEVEIVYCTSSKEFAIDTYEIHALGYFLKPYEPDKLGALIDYYIQKHPKNSRGYIEVKSRRKSVIIPYDEIIYAESENKVVYIHTKSQGDIKIYSKLDELNEQMRDRRFLRCHQSYLLNMDYVSGLIDYDFIMSNDDVIPIRKSGRRVLMEQYETYYKESLGKRE